MNKDMYFGASSVTGELLLWNTHKNVIMATKKILKCLWRDSYKTCWREEQCVIQGLHMYWIFLTMQKPLNNWEGMLFLIWSLSQLNRRAKWIKAEGGEEGWVYTRHILKVRKEERRGKPTPSQQLSCHSKESQAKFGTYRGKKKFLSFNSCPATENVIFKAV